MLSKGYQYGCGNEGNNLSEDQKQKILIARAIIRKPKILILDETTSALEEKSQKEMRQSLNEMIQSCTSIVLSQNQNTLKKCDRVVKIYKGYVVEDSEN